MKKPILTCFLILLTAATFAQVFEKDTIVWSGPDNNRINMVILGDGYTESQLAQFVTDAQSFTASLFSKAPYNAYANYFNVISIKVPSNESGASHPGTATDVTEPVHPISVVDNYFGSTFDYSYIHRLLVATKTIKIVNVLANNFPAYDVVLILVNTPHYGGSGGNYPAASLHSSSDEIAIHELGHSFAKLKDEYYAGDYYAAEAINMTQETSPDLVRWVNWMGDAGIGIYPHSGAGNASSWYRPHQSCKMKQLNFPFCAVCQEGTIERIHSFVDVIDAFSPENAAPLDMTESQVFHVDLVHPSPNTLKVNWTLNGNALAQNIDSVTVELNTLSAGINEIEVTIEDTTPRLRVNNHETIHISTLIWTIDATVSGVTHVSKEDFQITLFPNPAQNYVSVQLADQTSQPYTVQITDIAGKHILTQSVTDHSASTRLDISNLSPGVYIVNFRFGNYTAISRKIFKQ